MNINALMQQAQKMQQQMTKKQKEFEGKEFEFSSNGGAIKIKMLGSKQLTSLEIDDHVFNGCESLETIYFFGDKMIDFFDDLCSFSFGCFDLVNSCFSSVFVC